MTLRLFLPAALAVATLAWAAAPAAAAPGHLSDTQPMQVTLPVKDRARAVAFYRDTLGVKVRAQGKRAAMLLDASGFSIRLEQSDKAAPTEGVEIYFSD